MITLPDVYSFLYRHPVPWVPIILMGLLIPIGAVFSTVFCAVAVLIMIAILAVKQRSKRKYYIVAEVTFLLIFIYAYPLFGTAPFRCYPPYYIVELHDNQDLIERYNLEEQTLFEGPRPGKVSDLIIDPDELVNFLNEEGWEITYIEDETELLREFNHRWIAGYSSYTPSLVEARKRKRRLVDWLPLRRVQAELSYKDLYSFHDEEEFRKKIMQIGILEDYTTVRVSLAYEREITIIITGGYRWELNTFRDQFVNRFVQRLEVGYPTDLYESEYIVGDATTDRTGQCSEW